MKKLSLIIIVLSFLFVSCSEDLVYQDLMETKENIRPHDNGVEKDYKDLSDMETANRPLKVIREDESLCIRPDSLYSKWGRNDAEFVLEETEIRLAEK